MNDIPQNPTNEAILQAIQSLQSKVQLATKKEKKEAPLKKEGNQEQLDHSKKVSSLIQSAIFSLEQVDVDNAKLHLQEALTELTSRQKLIKIADRSPLGWSTIKEYVTDELANDSGDKKRLRKAEKSAAAKKTEAAKKTRAAQQKYRPRPYPSSSRPVPLMQRPFRAFSPVSSYRIDNRICFQCGLRGHVREICPSIRRARRQSARSSWHRFASSSQIEIGNFQNLKQCPRS